jgi:catechol 2,3-dioxygenase-like lactoylglutathione lyase family enzyme
MTIKRLDHVSVVVDDLAAAVAFFTELGMAVEGEMPVEGPWVDRVNGLESVQVDIVMMRTPDKHGRLELTKFRNPKLARSNRRSHRRTRFDGVSSGVPPAPQVSA